MSAIVGFIKSTIGRKILMAASGFVLSGFVLVHMLGNLQFLISPEAINAYAHHLQTLPWPILWGFRVVMLGSVAVHATMALWLAHDKRTAREPYAVQKPLQATLASRTMMVGGILLLAFVIFHILHFTLKVAPAPYTPGAAIIEENGVRIEVPDVYTMIVDGFKNVWVSTFYIVGMGALCFHLSHGVSSMFQTVGLRNEKWRLPLGWGATLYGIFIFAGFAIIPVSVLAGWRS